MQNYSFQVAWSPEDGEYVATSPEFPGLSGLGPTAPDAIQELQSAMEVAIQAYREDDEAIPEPRAVPSYSGQLRLRLPKGLHAAAASRAEQEGVSLNALLLSYVAQGIGAQEVRSQLWEAVGALYQNPSVHSHSKGTSWLHSTQTAFWISRSGIAPLWKQRLSDPLPMVRSTLETRQFVPARRLTSMVPVLSKEALE